MSTRFLTPSKLALLTLISLYCDGDIPPEATLDVLTFISPRLIWPGPVKHLAEKVDSLDVFAGDLRQTFESCMAASDLGSLWQLWNNNIWRLENLDDLFDFFTGLEALFYPRHELAELQDLPGKHRLIVLTRTSVIGMFVRRARLEWERLSFQDADALWQNFCRFRDPLGQATRKAHELDEDSFDFAEFNAGSNGVIGEILNKAAAARKGAATEATKAGDLSNDDMERLFEFQIETMQKRGVRVPEAVRLRLHDTIKGTSVSNNLSNYERFLDAWYSGDYLSSFEHLHRFYDYAMYAKDRSQYQYALLNMAILHADFGCYDESLAAMDEAVTASRDNKDMPCLNFALSWLHHFRNVYRGHLDHKMEQTLLGTDAEGLAFLKSKAQEYRMWSVMITAMLDEARLYLMKGLPPYDAIIRTLEAVELISVHNVKSIEASVQLVQSSIYSRLGISNLSTAYCLLVLTCHKAEIPIADTVRAKCRLAYHCGSVSQLQAMNKSILTMPPEALRNFKLSQLISSHEQLQALNTALGENNLGEAKELIDSLLSTTTTSVEPEVRFLAALASLKYYMRLNNFSKAFAKVSQMLNEIEKSEGDTYQYIRLLSAKATVFSKAGKPEKGFTLAVRAAGAAYAAKMLPALWEAVAVLAGVLNGIKSYSEAERLARSVLYQAMESDDSVVILSLQLALADACVGQAEQSQRDLKERDQSLRRAQNSLDAAAAVNVKVLDKLTEVDIKQKQVVLARLLRDPAVKVSKLENELDQLVASLGLEPGQTPGLR